MSKLLTHISHAFGWWRYALKFRRFPHLNPPRDLNEKIMWLSRHSDFGEMTRLADKNEVRQFIKERGLERILIPQYQCCDTVDEIDYGALPKSFVIKTTSGSGNVIVVNDKDAVGIDVIKNKLKSHTPKLFGFFTGEPHYMGIKQKFVVEEKLDNAGRRNLVDYKFWCFNGKVHSCMVCTSRDIDGHSVNYMSYSLPDWQRHPERMHEHYRHDDIVPKPECLDDMIKICETLSQGFVCVRVDLYEAGGKVYFGEMTFTGNAGRMRQFSDETLLEMGKDLKLPIDHD